MRRLIAFILLFITLSVSVSANNIARLRGNNLSYDEVLEQLIASGNASLIHPDFEVYANQLIVNTQLETVDGIGSVYIIKDDQQIESDRFYLDLNSKNMSFNDITLTIKASNKKDKIIISAQNFNETDDYKSGSYAMLTTCDFETPHYYLKAKSFKLYPEDRIISHHVTSKSWIWFIPFGFYMPTHIYELGKRKVVYLWPQFGSNSTEGTWFKSQFDYYFDSDNWGSTYVDYMSNFGVGLGIKHHYKKQPSGSAKAFSGKNDTNFVEYYSILNHEFENIRWKHSSELGKNSTAVHDIQNFKRPSGTSFAKQSSQKASIIIDPIGDNTSNSVKLDVSHTNRQSSQSKSDDLEFKIEDFYQSKKQWDILGKRKKTTKGLKNDTFKVTEKHSLFSLDMTNTIDYLRFEKLNDDDNKQLDQDLKFQNTFTKTFDGGIQSVTSRVDLTFDPDEETFDDNEEVIWIEKRPEFEIKLKQRNAKQIGLSNLTFNEKIIYGNYYESRFVEEVGQTITEGTMLKFEESAKLSYSSIPGIKLLNFTSSYAQYQFDTGDQGYKLTLGSTLTTDWFDFLKTNSSYTRNFSPEESNSPFSNSSLGNLSNTDTESITEDLTFYYDSPSKYKLNFKMGYDLKARERQNLQIKSAIIPNKTFKFDASTTFKWSDKKYTNLRGSLNYTPSDQFKFTNSYDWDLNEGFLKSINETIELDLFRNNWLAHWKLKMTFSYTRSTKDHHLSDLTFTKDLHCRTFTISWNKAKEEYRFGYSINAFESDKIELLNDKTGKTEIKTKSIDTDNKSKARY